MIYVQLIYEFFKIGLLAIGGGLATLPFLQELSVKTGWFTTEMLANMVAVSESTPGPIGINMASYVGFHTGGIAGGIVATLSLVCPSVIVCVLIAKVLDKFNDSAYVKSVFNILRPVVVGLIGAAGYQIFKISVIRIDLYQETGMLTSLLDWKGELLFAILFLLVIKWKKHPLVYIGIGAVAGILLRM